MYNFHHQVLEDYLSEDKVHQFVLCLFLGLMDNFWLVAGALVVGWHWFVMHNLDGLLRKRLLLGSFGTGDHDRTCRGLLHRLILSKFFNIFGRHLLVNFFVLLI